MKKVIPWFITLVTVSIVMIILFIPACTLSPRGISVLDGDYASPEFLEAQFTSSSGLVLFFTEAIDCATVELQDDNTQAIIPCSVDTALSGQTSPTKFSLPVEFSEQTLCGFPYTLFAQAEDESGNSITFSFSFAGYNERVPSILLNEVRTEYSKPKVEFIELKVCEDGNIGGVVLYNAYDGEEAMYIFPSVEVKKDDFIVLHYRTIEENCINELTSLDQSEGTESNSLAWDFWVDGTSARIGKNDVILLKKSYSGEILDALLLSESEREEWKTEEFEKAAKSAYDCGKWKSGYAPSDAFCTDSVTVTRTLSRQDNGSWIVTATRGASPGCENSTKPYIK